MKNKDDYMCKHSVRHTKYSSGIVFNNGGTSYLKQTITTYCADCGKKLKEVEVKD